MLCNLAFNIFQTSGEKMEEENEWKELNCQIQRALEFLERRKIISREYWFVWFWFYGISTIVGYLMLNPLYIYILDIYDLVWLGFMAYQPL